jgi:hypothetical protein
VKVTSGRFFTPGLYEIVVGKHAAVENDQFIPLTPVAPTFIKSSKVFSAC